MRAGGRRGAQAQALRGLWQRAMLDMYVLLYYLVRCTTISFCERILHHFLLLKTISAGVRSECGLRLYNEHRRPLANNNYTCTSSYAFRLADTTHLDRKSFRLRRWLPHDVPHRRIDSCCRR